MCGTKVRGPASVSGATGPALLGGTSGAPCGKDAISGPVTLAGNTGGVVLARTTISGPASITSNSGDALIAGNTITGPLPCSGNNLTRPTAGSPTPSAARPPAGAPVWPDRLTAARLTTGAKRI